ncbi:MAG: HAD family hydrolase [Butyricicoccaceae bacterium]
MKKPIQAVIFDLDGTLLNTLGDLRNAVNYALRRRGWPERTTEEVCAFVGNGIRNLMRLSMPEGMPDDVIDAGLAEFYEYYSAHMQEETVPYDGILELLRQLKADGKKIGILSNKVHTAAVPLCRHYFGDLPDVIFGERPGVPRKPDPTSCLELMEKLGVTREETVYVGDSGVDMNTARNAGLLACGVTWGFRSRQVLLTSGANLLIDTPAGLLRNID